MFFYGALSSSTTKGGWSSSERSSAWRSASAQLATQRGQLPPGRHVGTHTLRRSYARHLPMNGVPLNYLSRWLGHSDIKTTLIYLELMQDPTGSFTGAP